MMREALNRHVSCSGKPLPNEVRTGKPVEVDYESNAGERTTRRLREIALDPPNLVAWCELRDDERTFALAGLRAVRL